jgi:hypothetical protein
MLASSLPAARRLLLGLAVIALALVPTPACAQDAASVFEAMRQAARAQVEGVDDYTVVADAFIFYAQKVSEDGVVRYRMGVTDPDGNPVSMTDIDALTGASLLQGVGPAGAAQMRQGDASTFAEAMSYAGTASVEGTTAHVLRTTDAAAWAQGFGTSGGTQPGQLDAVKDVAMYVGTDPSVLLRSSITMEAPMGNSDTPVTVRPTTTYADYRTTDGVLLPHRLTVDPGFSDEAKTQIRSQVEDEGNQMMLNMLEDTFSVRSFTVQEVRVNTGDIDESVFENSFLERMRQRN